MKKKFTLLLMAQPFFLPLLFLSVSFFPKLATGQPVNQTFNTSGTYVVPAGYTVSVIVEAWGGGGGGGITTSGAKGGGAGGAYASSTLTLTSGSYTVVIGAGGAPGVNGGNSGFGINVIAEGGGAALGVSGGAAGSSTGSTGTIVIEANAGFGKNGNDGGAGGEAANSGGAGGTGGLANNGSGLSGTAPGGGGGGKAGPGGGGVSGSGADGRVTVTVNMLLPVGFSNIKAYEKQNGVQIDWTVNSEGNLDKYQVERSTDGINFMVIGSVAARHLSSVTTYNYLDAYPFANVGYYRIRSVSADGRSTFSHIIKINLNKNVMEFSIYPNPVANGYVSFQSANLAKGNYSLKLINAAGQQVYTTGFVHSGGAVNQTIQLPVTTRAGMYSIQLNNEVARVMGKVIMIQ